MPVITTVIGTLVGSGIAAFISFREQQRGPKLLLLEKRIESYSKLYGTLYEVATCFHRNSQA